MRKNRPTETNRKAILAAGMLEDFLGKHGKEYANVVIELARNWERFKKLLPLLWQGSMDEDTWAKIKRFNESQAQG